MESSTFLKTLDYCYLPRSVDLMVFKMIRYSLKNLDQLGISPKIGSYYYQQAGIFPYTFSQRLNTTISGFTSREVNLSNYI